MEFNPDSPLSEKDDAEDLLGRSAFCKRIAERIQLPKRSAGLVVSIEGPWGFGKTSAINLISKELKSLPEKSQPIVVHFNPWMVGSLDSLVQEFFLQISSSINIPQYAKKTDKLGKALATYSRVFTLGKLIPGAEPFASLLEKLLGGVSDVLKGAADLSELNIAKQKEKVSDAILDLGKAFVVFIDDLDRLPPNEVFAMIRLVKAVSNFPQVAYVMAFDPSYVEKALESAGIVPGRSYLDKIIQVRVSLPHISPSQLGIIIEKESESLRVDSLLEIFPDEKNRLIELYHYSLKFLLRTPRDIYRVFNRLRVLLPGIKKEVGFADLLALETIAITSPRLYDHIRKTPEAYVGPLDRKMTLTEKAEEIVKKFEKEREFALENCAPESREFLSALIVKLFPLTHKGISIEEKRNSRMSGRIASHENLIIALSGDLLPSKVSLSQIRSFIEMPDERNKIIKEVSNFEQIEDFLDLINIQLKNNQVIDPEGFIQVLSEISEYSIAKEIDRRRGADIFGVEISLHIFWILRQVLEKIDKQSRDYIIRKIIRSKRHLGLSVNLLRYLCSQQGRIRKERKIPEEQWLVSSSELDGLIQVWLVFTKKAFMSGSAWNSNQSSEAFFLLKLLDPNAIKGIVSKCLKSKKGNDNLFRALWPGSCDSVKGDFVQISESLISDIGDLTEIRRIAKRRLEDRSLKDPDLLAIYSNISSGKKQYVSDFESKHQDD